jgi:hypothetical protein
MISQVNGKNGRFYTKGNKKYRSVTYFVGKYEPKDWLIPWYKKLAMAELSPDELEYLSIEEQEVKLNEVGGQLGEKIKNDAGIFGTQMHKLIEDYYFLIKTNKSKEWLNRLYEIKDNLKIEEALYKYFLKDLEEYNWKPAPDQLEEIWKKNLKAYYPFLQRISPCGIEEKVLHEVLISDHLCGFGGTLDLKGKLLDNTFIDYSSKQLIKLHEPKIVLDWKNPIKPKYPKAQRRDGTYYYPLLKYGLQLSAYCQATDVKHAIVFLAPTTSKTNMHYIYYFSQEAIEWLWLRFVDILFCDKFNVVFDWAKFEEEAGRLGYIGQRLLLSEPKNVKNCKPT